MTVDTKEEKRKPKRRFTVTIEVGGDAWIDVARSLRELLPHIEDHGPKCDSVSGGVSSGHWVHVVEDQEMTPEKYHAALDAYLAEVRR